MHCRTSSEEDSSASFHMTKCKFSAFPYCGLREIHIGKPLVRACVPTAHRYSQRPTEMLALELPSKKLSQAPARPKLLDHESVFLPPVGTNVELTSL